MLFKATCFPKRLVSAIVRTSRGEEKVIANDIFRERVMLRGVDGEVRTLALSALRDEMLTAGDALAHALTHAAAAAELAAATTPLPVRPDEDDEISPDEALDTEHSPDHLAGIGAAIDPSLDVTMEWPAPRPAQEGRRPQRRRGRRGGRRNRYGGANGARAPEDEAAPSEGES